MSSAGISMACISAERDWRISTGVLGGGSSPFGEEGLPGGGEGVMRVPLTPFAGGGDGARSSRMLMLVALAVGMTWRDGTR